MCSHWEETNGCLQVKHLPFPFYQHTFLEGQKQQVNRNMLTRNFHLTPVIAKGGHVTDFLIV